MEEIEDGIECLIKKGNDQGRIESGEEGGKERGDGKGRRMRNEVGNMKLSK